MWVRRAAWHVSAGAGAGTLKSGCVDRFGCNLREGASAAGEKSMVRKEVWE